LIQNKQTDMVHYNYIVLLMFTTNDINGKF